MKPTIEKKLQALVNKNLMYGNHLLTITGYRFDEAKERVYISTNEKADHFDRPYDGATEFLKQFTEVKGELTKMNTEEVATANATSLTSELKDILLDNIKKVQQNPAYVKQATVINNTVNTMVNITKLQMGLMKENRKNQ